MNTAQTLTFAAFARLLGCKPSAVTALKLAGRLILTADGKQVQVAQSLARIEATRDPSKAGVTARHAAARGAAMGQGATTPAAEPVAAADVVEADDEAEAIVGGYQGSRARREHYQALEAQRAYEVAIGKLMDAAEVASAVANAITVLRTGLERLPDTLGPQLAAIHDEAQARAVLAEAIEQALEETARQFANLAKQVAA